MRITARLFTVLALGAGLAACGDRTAPVDADLARDLERIGGSALELAPSGAGTQVMSVIEQAPRAPAAAPAPSPTRARVAQTRPQPRQQQVQAPRPSRVATERAPAPAEESEVAAPTVSNPPLGAGPPPPGGWRSVNDVIRNSRVPITPVGSVRGS